MDTPQNNRLKLGLINHLSEYVSPHKKEFIDKVLKNRTRHITVVLEDIFQSQNASAVLRTCECLGIQDLHVVENRNEYRVNKDVVKGSSKWISLIRYKSMGINNTEACFRQLRTNGYTIVGTVTSPDAIPLEELDLTKKVALVFGNELDGLSNYATQAADVRSRIPLFGFTESFNISVAAAIYLYHLITRLQSMDIEWRLSDHEKLDVKLDWLKRSVQRSEILEKAYLKSNA